jgi:oligoendopeptidase F
MLRELTDSIDLVKLAEMESKKQVSNIEKDVLRARNMSKDQADAITTMLDRLHVMSDHLDELNAVVDNVPTLQEFAALKAELHNLQVVYVHDSELEQSTPAKNFQQELQAEGLHVGHLHWIVYFDHSDLSHPGKD